MSSKGGVDLQRKGLCEISMVTDLSLFFRRIRVAKKSLRVIMVGGLVLLCCLVAETIGMLRRN